MHLVLVDQLLLNKLCKFKSVSLMYMEVLSTLSAGYRQKIY